jgi:hypothetical protein
MNWLLFRILVVKYLTSTLFQFNLQLGTFKTYVNELQIFNVCVKKSLIQIEKVDFIEE